MKKRTVNFLSESGICVALATVLSLLTLFRLPYGGSVTVVSMLPICIIAYRWGTKYGLACGFVHGMLQLMLGVAEGVFKGADLATTIGMVVFDYLAAFTMLGFAGMFRDTFKSKSISFSLGCLVSCLMRYVCHIISGYIFFKSYAEWFFSQEGFTLGAEILNNFGGEALYWIYTVVYNGTFMVPEMIITSVAAFAMAKIPVLIEKTK